MASEKLLRLAEAAEERVSPAVRGIERVAERNQWKVISAFQKNKISDYHFAGSTGYGYNDRGRELLDEVYANVFGAEAALVRPHFVSGTHTIGTALFGVLRPGDKLLFITGTPYDTLHKVIGTKGNATGSLRDWGIEYDEVPLREDGGVDWNGIREKWTPNVRVVGLQRSRGYSWRKAFTIDEIAEMVEFVKGIDRSVVVFADNCYGEFTEEREPAEVGVDLIAGSLIKNPGGGLAPTGGYIAGKREWVEQAAYRLTAPGIGAEVGSMLGATRLMYQGLFLAPHAVGQAMRGAVFAAALLESLGFVTHPHWEAKRSDIIQAVRFESAEQTIAFVQGIQRASAVDSHVVPEPWDMPGYEHPVIMAAGTFIQGGSLELSADAPIRAPYTAYMQGGLTYAHSKLGVMSAVHVMDERGLLKKL